MAGESSTGPTRTPSRVSHRDSPMGSRRATPAPLPLPHLSLLRDFLNQTVLVTGLSSRMAPSPSDYSLSEFSEGETFIIPLLCRTLEAIGATNERLDLLTATVENLELTAQPPHPSQHTHITIHLRTLLLSPSLIPHSPPSHPSFPPTPLTPPPTSATPPTTPTTSGLCSDPHP